MQSKASTAAAYLKELPDDRRRALTKLRTLIRKLAPDAEEHMTYGMPGYAVGKNQFCGLAAQKGYMALYICPSEVVDPHRTVLAKLNCGKGCIRFKKLDDLPLSAVTAMVKEAYRRSKQ
ncbi:hypothetical protein AYO40_07015 [Planctomycetaceae bacterium SCGC AG-212-D15]|nr:hypothetical protein AYO40_07015 [Planctomycetaceae bacterium SCGC AG-212-D15]